MTPEQELIELVSDWRNHVDQLPIWSAGEERLHALMSAVLGGKIAVAERGVDFPEFSWEVLLDYLLSWHFRHPFGDEPCTEEGVHDAVFAAMQAMRFESLSAALQIGAYRVRKTGNNFRVTYKWDMGLEVADLYLERQAAPVGLEGPTEKEMEWASGQSRAGLNPFDPPGDVIRATFERTRRSVQAWRDASQESPLSDSIDLGDGLTVGVMANVLAALMAVAELGEMAHSKGRVRGTTLQHATEEAIVESVGRLCDDLSQEVVLQAIRRLMAGPGKSMRTSLLIPNSGLITILPLVMFPRAIDAIVLRTAAADRARYGPIGQRLGERAVAWGRWLTDIPGAMIAESVGVRDPGRRIAGDLDVVAVDPSSRKGLVLEVKWPIDAVTLRENSKTDELIIRASVQLGRVRGLLRAGVAHVKFPDGWPDFNDIDWSWGIGAPQQLTSQPLPESDMFATSFRYVSRLGQTASLSDLIAILENPIVPELNKHYRVGAKTLSLGRHFVLIEVLECKVADWKPNIGS
ncbi:hypothetical protein ACFZAM_10445 [Streptomyces sp. NPDC008079]|uniref:hypothetical protein n=1 Tax=Streptomyces sp. NPDC008079 TaxID=3364806 RepID=UPI0036E7A390